MLAPAPFSPQSPSACSHGVWRQAHSRPRLTAPTDVLARAGGRPLGQGGAEHPFQIPPRWGLGESDTPRRLFFLQGGCSEGLQGDSSLMGPQVSLCLQALQRHGLRTMPYVPERAPHEIWGMCGVHEDGDRRELGADSVYFPGMFVPPKGGISDDQLMKSLLGKSLQVFAGVLHRAVRRRCRLFRAVPRVWTSLPQTIPIAQTEAELAPLMTQRKGKAHHLAKEPKPIRSAPMVVPGWTGLERSASASPSTQVYSSRPGADLTKQPPGEEGPRRSGDAMRHAAPVANTASIFHAETAAAGQTRPADAETLLSQVRAVKEALELETAARLGIDRPPYTFQPAAPGIWSSNELPGNALPDEGSGTPGAPMSAAPGMDVVGTSPMSGPPAQPSLQVHRGPETSGPKEPARLRFEHARASPEPQLKGVGAQAPPVTRQGRGGGAVEAAPAFEKGNGFRSSPTSRGGSRACPSLAHAALSHEKDEIMELASAVQHVYVRLDDLARQKDRVASPADVLGQPAKSHGVSAADAMLELLKTAGDRKKAYLAELAGLDSPARSTP